MDNQSQSFASHAKFDPSFHFFVLPVLLINVIVIIVQLFRTPTVLGAWLMLTSIALFLFAGRTRSYATHLQDRIIRIEERVRMQAILPEPLRARIGEVTDDQFVGLRFASDAELPALTQRALDEKLTRKDIKKAVTSWRPDNSRV